MNKPLFSSVSERECVRPGSSLPRVMRDVRRAFGRFRRVVSLAGGVALVLPFVAFAQTNAVLPRISERIDATQLTTLSGNTHPLARGQYDQGAAPPDLPMNRMMLILKRGPEQESALQDLLVQQQTNSSANFRKWLTPDQFGQQFGLADADIQAVTSWLTSFGFQGIKVAKGRNIIEFSGTAAQVEAGLHTSIHKYFVNGEYHWANSNDPQIPTALAPVISGVVSLHDFHPKPTIIKSDRKLTATVTQGERPQIDFADGTHGLVPGDFNTIYNIGPTMTGSGVTIGVIADTNINVQDVDDFRSLWGLPTNSPTVILNGPDPGDIPGSGPEGEAVLDATWSGAVAPQARVDLVVSEDTNAAAGTDLSEFYIIDNNVADVMTESFESCESFIASIGQLSGAATFYSGMAEQAAAQGITFSVASGDGGPDACDDPSTTPTFPTAASVNILASTPFNVAVGGTMFNDVANPSTYWSAKNAANGGSALSYIPEDAWNEACTTLSATCEVVGIWSSGGGQSIAFAKPVWQAGVAGIPSMNARFTPDVSMTAANHDGYVLCIDQSCQGINCPRGTPAGTPCFATVSGTSASAQAFGGVMALVVQKMGGRVGIANYALYKLAATETLSNCNASSVPSAPSLSNCIFNDVTVGNTNIPGETGFTAGVGYDQTTGLGSVNVSNLVNKWNTAVVEGTTTALTLNNGSPVNITHGTAVPVNITVSPVPPATGTPTGDVSLIANSNTDLGVDCFTLNGASSNCEPTNSTIFLPGGTYQVHAHYEGDGTFLGSDSTPPITVTVGPEGSEINFGIVVTTATTCFTPTSITYGSPYILTVDVSDLHVVSTPCVPSETGSSPTGLVTLTDSFNGGTAVPLDGGTFKLNGFGYFEDQTIQLPAGTHTITANYQGDNSFTKSGPVSGVIVVAQATTTTSVAANPTTASVGQNVVLTATVAATQSNAIANTSQEPTGTVQFFVNGVAVGSPVQVNGVLNSSVTFAQSTATMSTSSLANGQNLITAKYSGDNNYAASAISPSVTVTVGSAGINLSPTSNTATISVPALGTPGTQIITVSAAGGFTGTVALTCAVTTVMGGVADLPTCNFTPSASITLTSSTTSGQQTLDVNTTAASGLFKPANRRHEPGPGSFLVGEICVALACMLLLSLNVKKRRGAIVLATAIVAVALIGAGCGGSSSGGNGGGNPGTTAGAYSVTVTATPSNGTAQSTTIAVNVP